VLGHNQGRIATATPAQKGKVMMARILLIFAMLIGLLGLTAPAMAAEGGWNPAFKDWSFRKSVTVDTSPSGVNVSGAVGRTVVLVRLHSGNFTFADALPNGADLRVSDSDNKTPLPFHIDRYDSQNGLATLWVSVPNVNGGEKRQIWLYFGNKTAPEGSDAKGTFDPDTMAAFHFGDNAGQPASDSTANANNSKVAPAGINDSGIIGRSAKFPGQGAITLDASGSLAMPAAQPLTITLWVKPANLAGAQPILTRGAFTLGLNAGVPYVSGPGVAVQAAGAVKQGDWSHIAFVADGTTFKIYVNGVEQGNASGAMPALDGPITLGGTYNGELDELRLAKTARPAGMILAMAQAEGPAGKLVSVSETPEKQSSGGGVIMFIVSKLEPVDQGIIAICLTLLAAAVWLMTAKIRYLNAADKGNQRFLRRFAEMEDELVPVAEAEGVSPQEAAFINKSSPVARLYAVGLAELDQRKRVWGNRPLSSEAVEAMRAAVDAQFVTENQKLDKLMVILTIAISGGPFIGLLGTVIGVMTVFGGVAMAGDVNVNAIAPGIAAALLATIAGLTCAIPALFGYNYLNGRLTALTDQMRVYIDRLITRLAEMQADAAAHAQAAE
jgi:biopolymer transport protein ExbB